MNAPNPRLSTLVRPIAAACVLLLGAGAGVALAEQVRDEKPVQKQSVTPTTHSLQDPSDAILDRLLGSDPTTQATPDDAVDGAQFRMPDADASQLLREGTFVVNRVGRCRQLDDDSLIFVFASDGDTPASMIDPPMKLVANLNLMAVERAVSTSPESSVPRDRPGDGVSRAEPFDSREGHRPRLAQASSP